MFRDEKTQSTFAFLDLDDTLIDRDAKKFNHALLDALKNANIKDICLFTSMDNRQIYLDLGAPGDKVDAVYTRPAIVKFLESEGFIVHAVITPLDLYEDNRKPGAYYQEKWLPAFQKVKNIYARKLTDKKKKQVTDQVTDIVDEVDSTMKAQQAREMEKLQTDPTTQIEIKTKAHMYQLAIDHLSDIPKDKKSIASIVYFDDRLEELENVRKKSESLKNPIPLTCIEVRPLVSKKGNEPGRPSDISLQDESVSSRYKEELDKHMKLHGTEVQRTRVEEILPHPTLQRKEAQRNLSPPTQTSDNPTRPRRDAQASRKLSQHGLFTPANSSGKENQVDQDKTSKWTPGKKPTGR